MGCMKVCFALIVLAVCLVLLYVFGGILWITIRDLF